MQRLKMAPWAQFRMLAILFLLAITCVSATVLWRATDDSTERSMMSTYADLPPEFVTFFYTQTLDHFNYIPESYQTFQQRYILNFKYWGGANTSSPIFVFAGLEVDLTRIISKGVFIEDLAARFNALQLYIEHRYYGESIPFGSLDNQNSSTLGYFSSTQALADYAQVILGVKKNLSEPCPVIVVGGSYGGMLATWFRLKYPHIAIGALASSAPLLYFDDITPHSAYYVVVSKDFRNASESCYDTVKQSWSEIDRIASEPNGLITLSNIFNSCLPLNSLQELKTFLIYVYTGAAQSDNPPRHYVKGICNAIDGAPEGTSTLGRVAAGVNASVYGSGSSCLYITDEELAPPVQVFPWRWQICTEIIIPLEVDNNDTMFQASPFRIVNYTRCQDLVGVIPRPHWITTYFGGHDIKSVLGNFGSNIIFSNGLRDPYSSGGVLEDISDTIVAIYTEEGSHCADLRAPMPEDPDWLVTQRDKEIKIIASWIAQYNARRSVNNMV